LSHPKTHPLRPQRAGSWETIFTASKKSFAGTLEALAPHRRTLIAGWKRELRSIGLQETSDPWKAAARIPRMSFRTLQRELEALGKDLARNQAPLQQVLLACARITESVLRRVRADPQRSTDVARFAAMAQAVLAAAYADQQSARVRSLEPQLAEAEKRLHGASAYVTNVYEQERRSLSHDLHDDIGHDLVMLKLHLELSAEDLDQQKLASLRRRMDAARVLVSNTIESVRRMVLDLGPTVFDDLGFLPAVRYYARRFSTSTGIEVIVEEGRLPAEIPLSHQTALYRILQGALSNVLKHARAKHVKVALASLRDAVLVMTIEDDGVGFDTGALRSGRFGLTAMRERVGVLGGKVHVESWRSGASSKRHGTRIEIDLPLPGGGRT
jgi:signal transduction histidine kinase